MPKVMLDAGPYGDYNRSPCVPEYYESHMSWKLCGLLKEALESYGITVGTTRADRNADLDVYKRGYKAKGYGMFVSLHSNAVGSYTNESIVYPIVYRLISDRSGFADKLSQTVESVMRTGANPRTGTRLMASGDEYYGVLRGAKAAGCTRAYIIEHSFHTATKPAKWLLDEDNLARLAKAEAEAIAEYFGIAGGKDDEKEDEKLVEELNKKVGALEKKVAELEKTNKIYRYWSEIEKELPWAYKPLMALYEKGIFTGESPADLNASYTLIRSLVCLAAALKLQGVIGY